MKWSRNFLSFLFFLFIAILIFGIFLSRSNIQVRGDLASKNHPKFYDYRGVTHVLSNYSSGHGQPTDIIAAASQAGISFLFFTDLNDFDSLHEINGYNQDVLVLSGKKISYLDSHMLLYSSKSFKNINSLGTANALATDLLQRTPSEGDDIMMVLAHPFKKGFSWDQEQSTGLMGIEILNLRHMWQQSWIHKKASFVWSLFIYIFNPKIALLRLINSPVKELQWWDKLNLDHKVIGFLGNHSTGKVFNLGFISVAFPTYEQSFQFASNHVLLRSELTGVYSRDKEKVFKALSQGQFYMALDSLANPKGFAAYMSNGKKDYIFGEEIRFKKNLTLNIDLPDVLDVPVEIKVYKDGKELKTFKDQIHSELILEGPGNYRVYVRLRLHFPIPGELRWIPWIYTNNFYVK